MTKANLDAFAKFAQKSYEEVKVDTIKNCFASWDDRRVALLAAKGGPVDW